MRISLRFSFLFSGVYGVAVGVDVATVVAGGMVVVVRMVDACVVVVSESAREDVVGGVDVVTAGVADDPGGGVVTAGVASDPGATTCVSSCNAAADVPGATTGVSAGGDVTAGVPDDPGATTGVSAGGGITVGVAAGVEQRRAKLDEWRR